MRKVYNECMDNGGFSKTIILNADETRLFLAAKGRKIKGVNSRFMEGSYSYVQAVCNHRSGMVSGADVFKPYMVLARKILTKDEFAIILSNLYDRTNNPFLGPTVDKGAMIASILVAISRLSPRDMILDESLVK